MDLPIKFPDDADVIAEEVRRFRALTPEAQVRTVGEMAGLYHFLAARSDRPDVIARMAAEDEARGRAVIEEFVTRYDRG